MRSEMHVDSLLVVKPSGHFPGLFLLKCHTAWPTRHPQPPFLPEPLPSSASSQPSASSLDSVFKSSPLLFLHFPIVSKITRLVSRRTRTLSSSGQRLCLSHMCRSTDKKQLRNQHRLLFKIHQTLTGVWIYARCGG